MTLKVFDTFDGVVDTDLSAHTPDVDIEGLGWADSGADTVELDGIGGVKMLGGAKYGAIDVGVTDQYIICKLHLGGVSTSMGIYIGGNADLTIAYGFFLFPPNNVLIQRRNGGSFSTIGITNTRKIDLTKTQILEAIAVGDNLKFILNGQIVAEAENTEITKGNYAGLYINSNPGGARFLEFEAHDSPYLPRNVQNPMGDRIKQNIGFGLTNIDKDSL